MSTRSDYVKARNLAIEADAKGLPSAHLWVRAQELRPADGGCDCPHKPDGRLDTPRGWHLDGCPLRGTRPSGPSGECSPAATARKRAKQAVVAIEGGRAALAEAAKRAGYESGSAFVAAAIQHARAGGKFISG